MKIKVNVAELRRLLGEATARPWEVRFPYNDAPEVRGPGGTLVAYCDEGDTALIAAAVNALPALLDDLERATTAVRSLLRLHERVPPQGSARWVAQQHSRRWHAGYQPACDCDACVDGRAALAPKGGE